MQREGGWTLSRAMLCLLGAIGFLLLNPGTSLAARHQSAEWTHAQPRDLSAYMLSLVNQDRAENGSPALEPDPKLDKLAYIYADYLLRTGYFAHVDPYGRTPEDRARLLGIGTLVAENLAWESSNFEDPSTLVKRAEGGMMAEPAGVPNHRFNILDPRSRYVGIGVARAGEKLVVVQEFADRLP